MSTSKIIACACGLAATAFVGYCIYFDRQRRKDPEYQKKIRERRRLRNQQKPKGGRPRLATAQERQQYFFSEAEKAEELMAQGEFDRAVEHLLNAVTVCQNPQQVLGALSQSLPPQVFQLLLQQLPSVLGQMQPEDDDDGLD